MKEIQLKNLVWKEGEHYVSQCLNVDVSSFGKTKKEALTNLDEALALYFEDSGNIKITKIERPEVIVSRICHA
ncbi:MAG: type II toxin-antitoxin system HicB family antitoxin [Candidatus Berkelbacteria bacterium]|nr:type II toxin-antitoxin system HicB family antitoxin [Candidatus Berkelbacteria bacterium]